LSDRAPGERFDPGHHLSPAFLFLLHAADQTHHVVEDDQVDPAESLNEGFDRCLSLGVLSGLKLGMSS
jgi:hypothetical protein